MAVDKPPSPKVDVLAALLQVYTVEQLKFIADRSLEAITRTGYGHIVLQFQNGHFRFIEQSNRFEAPLKNDP